MIQEILTYITVILAVTHTIIGLIKLFKRKSATTCASGTCSCGGKGELFKEIRKGKKPFMLTSK